MKKTTKSAKPKAKKASKGGNVKVYITKEMTIGEIITRYPQVIPVILEQGLHCIGCGVAAGESIADGLAAHGKSPGEIDEVLMLMNKAVADAKVSTTVKSKCCCG
jgi:hybrid cluster-associated redox disulfide protein